MKNSTKLSLIAAAMGGLMAGASSHAVAASPAPITGKALVSSSKTAPVIAGVRALDDTVAKGTHDCKGKNDCKGQGGCKTGDAGCKGKNTCKGNGGCKTGPDKPSDANGK